MNILITLIATTLIFLSGVGIGAALTDLIIDKEGDNERTETSTTETIEGRDDSK